MKETQNIDVFSSRTCEKVCICDVTDVENSRISKVNISLDILAAPKIFYRNVVNDLSYHTSKEKEALVFDLNSPLTQPPCAHALIPTNLILLVKWC